MRLLPVPIQHLVCADVREMWARKVHKEGSGKAMTKCICACCGRTVNGRVPAKGGNVEPYRHLPPSELGKGSYQHEDGTASWFGASRWCGGSFEPVKEVLNAIR